MNAPRSGLFLDNRVLPQKPDTKKAKEPMPAANTGQGAMLISRIHLAIGMYSSGTDAKPSAMGTMPKRKSKAMPAMVRLASIVTRLYPSRRERVALLSRKNDIKDDDTIAKGMDAMRICIARGNKSCEPVSKTAPVISMTEAISMVAKKAIRNRRVTLPTVFIEQNCSMRHAT